MPRVQRFPKRMMVHVRLDGQLVRSLDIIAAENNLWRNSLIEILLEKMVEMVDEEVVDIDELIDEYEAEEEEEEDEDEDEE